MVKKSTFLEKLFGARRERELEPDGGTGRGGAVRAPADREAGNGEAQLALRKAKREEVMQALTDGFKDLAALLRGIQDRMEEQGKRTGDLGEKVADLPALAKAQVEFMTAIRDTLVQQKEKTAELLERLGNLPEALEGIHRALEKQVAAEERSERTLAEFRASMNRIHASIGELSKESAAAVREATTSLERTHERTTKVFEKTQAQAYTAFEKAQRAHLAQLKTMMERTARMNRTIVVLLVIVFSGLAALFGIVLAGGLP